MGDAGEKLNIIKKLVKDGVLGAELCPQPKYWHWPVLNSKMLPDRIKEDYDAYGEIRWYWD